jgi:hypothetical protein
MARRGRPPRPGGRPAGRKRRPPRDRNVPAGPQIPDTPQAKLEEETRKAVIEIMAARKADRGLNEGERLLSRVIEQHPEYLPLFERAGEHLATGDETSPFLHVALHRIVEQRVVARELPDDMSRLTRDKPWHEAVHDVSEHIAGELFPQATAVEG